MSDFKPPPRMNFDGDIAHNWGEWYQLFQLYLEATESTEKSDGTKIAMLLTTIGPDGVRRLNQFVFTPDTDKAKYDKVVEKFESELSGKKRVVFNRFKFWEFKRAEHQGFDDFLVKLRVLAGKCDFASAELNNMLRDKIVFVTTDKRLQERLLRERTLHLRRLWIFVVQLRLQIENCCLCLKKLRWNKFMLLLGNNGEILRGHRVVVRDSHNIEVRHKIPLYQASLHVIRHSVLVAVNHMGLTLKKTVLRGVICATNAKGKTTLKSSVVVYACILCLGTMFSMMSHLMTIATRQMIISWGLSMSLKSGVSLVQTIERGLGQ